MKKKKCVLVFSGFNQRAVISFIRTMHANKVDYAIIAVSKEDPIFLTDFSHKILAVRRSRALNLEDLLDTIRNIQSQKDAEEYIIAPVTEALNRFLLDNRTSFEQHKCTIPLVDQELYEKISNKYSFGDICERYGINVPEEVDITSKVAFPIVAKPREYYSTDKQQILSPMIIHHQSELDVFLSKHNRADFYYQEYVDGKCVYLLYYFHSDGQVYKFSQENLVQQPGGKSMLVAVPSDFHYSQESDKYVKLFKDLDFTGLVMVEVKHHNNIHYMIEANPRFWGPSQLFVDAGANFFEVFLHDVGVLESFHFPKEVKSSISYFWYGGLLKYAKHSFKEVTFHNYNGQLLVENFGKLLIHDIYLRQDTMQIFANELSVVKERSNL